MQQQQSAQPASKPVGAARRVIPPQITWAVVCVVAFVVLNLIVAGLLVSHRGEITDTIRRSNPTWGPSQVDTFVNGVIVGGGIIHLIFAVLSLWLAFMVQRGRRWARIAVTVVLVLNLVIGLFSFASPVAGTAQDTTEQLIHIVSTLFKLAAIGLLWLPRASRAYFAKEWHG